jgi:hypothetical protein
VRKAETHLFFLEYLKFKYCYFYSLLPSLITAEVRKYQNLPLHGLRQLTYLAA